MERLLLKICASISNMKVLFLLLLTKMAMHIIGLLKIDLMRNIVHLTLYSCLVQVLMV